MRTINDIYKEILSEKDNMPTLKDKLYTEGLTIDNEQTLLNDLTSTRKVAIYRLWAYIVAVAIWVHESLWELFRKDITNLISTKFLGTGGWLVEKAKEFQYGDDIIIDPVYFHPKYEVVDESKRIIASASITEGGGEVYLKVRRKDTDILLNSEYESFESYLNKIKIAGQRINILNFDGDELRLYFTIYYDPIYPLDTLKNEVFDKINYYIENIDFDSNINITTMIDRIQEVKGIKGVQYDNGLALSEGNNTWIQFENYYMSKAGWNKIHSAYPLTDTITFIPKI